jgi:hypothetical protein
MNILLTAKAGTKVLLFFIPAKYLWIFL